MTRRREGAGGRGRVAALVAVLVIGAAFYWVASALRAHDAAQDCIDAGRRGCLALPDR